MFKSESVLHSLFSPGKNLDGIMLTTLIYRSQIPLTHEINLSLLVEKANVNNMSHGVSGILLFKDNVILQVLG